MTVLCGKRGFIAINDDLFAVVFVLCWSSIKTINLFLSSFFARCDDMNIDEMLSDEAVLAELGQRLARIRVERDYTQAMLAEQAGVSKRTLERLEAGASCQLNSFIRVLRVLDLLGALEQLLPAARPGPMALLQGKGKQPQRARPRSSAREPAGEWQWGDEP